jgi:hypothetical protein
MKYADINKRFSEIVAEYLSKGYAINTATMCGTQGEIAKVDLTDGKEIIRVKTERFHEGLSHSGVEIMVGRCTDNVKPNEKDKLVSVWNQHLEVLYTERFYNIRYSDWFVTEEEAEQAQHLHRDRAKLAMSEPDANQFKSDKALEIAKHYIRRKTGVKRIKADCITVSKCGFGRATYMVSYRDKVYILR